MIKSPGWIALSILYVLAGLISVMPVMMLPMMFDAPGSEKNGGLIAVSLLALAFPVFCLLGAILPWLFRRRRFARWLFLLPAADIIAIVLGFFAASGGRAAVP